MYARGACAAQQEKARCHTQAHCIISVHVPCVLCAYPAGLFECICACSIMPVCYVCLPGARMCMPYRCMHMWIHGSRSSSPCRDAGSAPSCTAASISWMPHSSAMMAKACKNSCSIAWHGLSASGAVALHCCVMIQWWKAGNSFCVRSAKPKLRSAGY